MLRSIIEVKRGLVVVLLAQVAGDSAERRLADFAVGNEIRAGRALESLLAFYIALEHLDVAKVVARRILFLEIKLIRIGTRLIVQPVSAVILYQRYVIGLAIIAAHCPFNHCVLNQLSVRSQ